MTTEYLAELAGLLDLTEDKHSGTSHIKKKLPNGDAFEGVVDLITGEILFGTRRYRNNKETYTGPFLRGLRHGAGAVALRSDGSKFIGRYMNDQPQIGTWISSDFTYSGGLLVDNAISPREGLQKSNGNPTPFHGYGKLFLKNGPIYEGEFKQGVYHGVGKEILPDGSRYTGEFENGERHGLGTLVRSDGSLQSGIWLHDTIVSSPLSPDEGERDLSAELNLIKMESYREEEKKFDDLFGEDGSSVPEEVDFTWPDGSKFIGSYDGNEPRAGTLITPAYTYIGPLHKNKFHGSGQLVLVDGATYEGEFYHGQYHGTGKFIHPDGSVYTGDFIHGNKHGIGTLAEPNGSCYSGDWHHDQREGEGIETLPSGEVYTGHFQKDRRNGNGSLSFKGMVMECLWKHGQPLEGAGWTISFPDGKKYTGEAKKSTPHGMGTMRYADESVYTGQWQQGKRHGKGLIMYSSGESFEGIWNQDQLNKVDLPTVHQTKKQSKPLYHTLESINTDSHSPQSSHESHSDQTSHESHSLQSSQSSQLHLPSHTQDPFPQSNITDQQQPPTPPAQHIDQEIGETYPGKIPNSKLHGKETFKPHPTDRQGSLTSDKTYYQGSFLQGKFHGKGTLTEDGRVYIGDFVSGLRCGVGKETFADDTIYRGEYKQNKRHGTGTLQRNKGGDVLYSGSWKDDLMDGEGVLYPEKFPDDRYNPYCLKFEGMFVRGQRSGPGTLSLSDGTVIKGGWLQDKPVNGTWMVTFPDGSVYSGAASVASNSEIPLAEGMGTMHYANGDFYTGSFVRGKREGKGLCLCENGDMLDGTWVKNDFVID